MRSGPAVLLLSAAMLAGCHGRVPEGDRLLDAGKVTDAERIAKAEVDLRPDDAEARLLLARVYMQELRPEDAEAALAPVANQSKLAPRIAEAYWRAATVPWQPQYAGALGKFAVAAAHFDPARRTPACQMLLGNMRRDRFDWKSVAPIAATIDASCERATLRRLRSWIDQTDPASANLYGILAIADAAVHIDKEASLDFAHSVRDLAQRAASSNKLLASGLLEGAARIDPAVHGELESVVLRSSLSSMHVPYQVDAQAMLSPYTDTARDTTMRVMRQIGAVLDMYASDNSRYPLAKNLDELEAMLRMYLRAPLPRVDGWGNPFVYASAQNSVTVRMISGGADGHVEIDSTNLNGGTREADHSSGADIIWENGRFIQQPDEASLRH